MSLESAIKQVHLDWQGDTLLRDRCEQVIRNLFRLPVESLRHISFSMLSKASGSSDIEKVVLVAEYLSSARLHLLTKHYSLVVDDEEFELTFEEVAQARRLGYAIHPDLGEKVPDYEEHLYLYFGLTELGVEVLGRRN